VVRVVSGALLSLSLIAAAPPEGARHPIHSTLTEITFDAPKRIATVRVRAFADDFGTATSRWGRSHPRAANAASPDSLGYDYVMHAVSLETTPGRFVAFMPCGIERTGAVIWFCLRTKLDTTLEGVRVADRILNDLFDDEINIVQVDDAGHRTSAIFTRNDVAKILIAKSR
jgi:hypothetical protein